MASDRVIMLINGKNYAEGTYDELKKLTDPKVKEFFE
jgi:phospholipid/cholesterol/gamma-HCH transport system ATP-binding protein